MIESPDRRITPWVGRLLAANAIVLLLQQTIFTSQELANLLSFEPTLALQRPWTFFSYMFLHAGILHLAGNSLALYMFGPTVERRFGSKVFISYYLLCGVGAAIMSMILRIFSLGSGADMPPGAFDGIVGASGAIIGVVYAYSRLLPDAELMVFPIPVPVKARYMILALAAFDVFGLFMLHDGIAHDAHLGGLATGIGYFLLRSLGRPNDTIPLPQIRHRVPVATRGGGSGQQTLVTPHPASAAREAPSAHTAVPETVELDRVLDKISATGINSLTAEERLFLDAMARRRRDLN